MAYGNDENGYGQPAEYTPSFKKMRKQFMKEIKPGVWIDRVFKEPSKKEIKASKKLYKETQQKINEILNNT